MENRIGKNLKRLRLAYNEGLEDVAFAVNVSAVTISNYENGKRTPKAEELRKLAKHFRVSVDLLQNEDIRDFNVNYSQLLSKDYQFDAAIICFPILLESSHADEHFSIGVKNHKKYLNDVFKGLNSSDLFDKAMKEYEIALENDCFEALANYLSLLAMMSFPIGLKKGGTHLGYLENAAKFKTESSLKQLLLYNFSEENLEDDSNMNKDISDLDISEMSKFYLSVVHELKNHLETIEIGDFYNAMIYMLGGYDTGNSLETDRIVGSNMLFNLAELDNEYALRWLKFTVDSQGETSLQKKRKSKKKR